ncbi:hypothetical protein GC093_27445 [Paenibacillus sp. LMG 31456]|uniref:Uncharacterized protein n=1 Tax=Paenibacillus foliorum TaxID=2654974 RepID=A0A972H1L8_9BACL|nr:hypothetical protein [Paenibacillus foliorum]NOU96930.1 hypothetical protein [Paenibacillus foliorum]
MKRLILTDKHLNECLQLNCLVEIRIWGKTVEVTRIISFDQYCVTVEDGNKYLRESCAFMKVGLRLI